MALKNKKTAYISSAQCVACGSCEKACPKGAVSILSGVYARVDAGNCIGCGLCGKACPASVIEMR
jgi:ferredoxin